MEVGTTAPWPHQSRDAHHVDRAAWLELALTAADPLAWTQSVLLDGDLGVCEPKQLRYRLLHRAARG